jgi:hypothetical protein
MGGGGRVSIAQGARKPQALHTLQICRLFLPERGASLLHLAGQANLDIPRHELLALARLADQALYPANALLAVMEGGGDLAGQALNLALLGAPVVIKARQDVLGVQLVELCALARNVGEEVCDLVRDVSPAGGEEVHLNDGIIVEVGGGGGEQEAAPLLWFGG